MKKLSILALLLLFASHAAFAQRTSTISAVATDDKSAEKISGAVLMLTSVADTSVVKYGMANFEGKIVIYSVPYGDYTVKLARMGYEDYSRKLTVNARTMNLGTLFLKESAIELDEVVVATQAIRTSQHGDTLIYNAKAFKVSEDADADELLKKLPGVVVGNDGTVTAQGEQVKKIFVDGKEYFGTDVTSTMKNIPANVIEKVETFRKLSDYSEYTGINDGEDFMAMNLVTNMKFGQMGRFSAGYNFEDKYDVSANYSIFGGPHFLTLNGSSNNTGRLNFGGNGSFGAGLFSSDIVSITMTGGGGRGGGGGRRIYINGMDYGGSNTKSTTHSAGLNYNYEKSEKFRANFNYRYGYRDSESKSSSVTEFLNPQLPYDRRHSNSNGTSTNNQHTIGGRIQWKIDDRQNFSFRPDLSFRSSPNTSFSHMVDSLTSGGINELVRDITNIRTNKTDQYSLSGAAQYYLRFDKSGRSLTVELSGSLSKDNGDNFSNYENKVTDSLGRSVSINHSTGNRIGARMTYTEPISEFWRLMASYNFSNNKSDRNSNTSKLDFDTEEYVPWGENSNIMTTTDITHRVGPGLNYSKNRDAVNINFNYQYTILTGKRTLPPPAFDSRVTFQNFVYDAMYQKRFNPENSLEFRTSSNTSNPSISQLQEVDNVNSAPYYSTGNSRLKPSDSYDGSLRYVRSSQTRGYTFMALATVNLTDNNIGDSTIIVTAATWETPNGTILQKGDQYSKPINKGSAWSSGGTVDFGMPLNFIKSNFNVNANYRYNESDSYLNGEEMRVYSHSIGSGVSLGTNFSVKFSANLRYSLNYNLTQYSDPDQKDYSYITHRINFDLRWITWKDFVISTDIAYNLDKSSRDNYSFDNTLCNISLGKKLFKNKRGELSLSVHDLFNQNRQFSRTVTAYSIENRKENLVQRYFTINFSYILRNINSPNSPGREIFEMRRERGGSMGPPMRMGGGRFMNNF